MSVVETVPVLAIDQNVGPLLGIIVAHHRLAVERLLLTPPGKLGLILANKSDGRGTMVSGVRAGSA